jgi:hypothetical protein
MLLDERDTHPNAKFMIVTISDGQSNSGLSYTDALDTIKDLDVAVHAIIFGKAKNQLHELALDSGGIYFRTKDAKMDQNALNFLNGIL